MKEDNPYNAGIELGERVRNAWSWMGDVWPVLVMMVALDDTIHRMSERDAMAAITGLRNALTTLERKIKSSP